MIATPLGIADQVVVAPLHLGMLADGYADLERRAVAFLRPALSDERQAVVLLELDDAGRSIAADLSRSDESFRSADREGRVRRLSFVPDANEILDRVSDAVDSLSARGFALTRLIGYPRWHARAFPHPEDHLWLESRLNDLVIGRSVVIMCLYDTDTAPRAKLILGGIETHPQLLIGDRIVTNASYVEADRFFRERLVRVPWLTPPT